MEITSLTLNRPKVSDRQLFLSGLQEMKTTSEVFSWIYLGENADLTFPERAFEEYVAMLINREMTAAPGFVTDTVFWAKIGNEIVGRISIRHNLNDILKVSGVHIGYIVKPSWRGRGVATEMLRQILLTKQAREIGKLLVTCDETNLASERTIRKNGGILENVIELSPDKPKKKRFWISVAE